MTTLLGLPGVLNISTLFREIPLLRRPAAAREAGYRRIEMWWPWEEAPVPDDAAADALIDAVEDAGVQLVGLNLYAGRLSGPDAGILSDPARGGEFFDNLDAALELGRRLGIRGFNTLYGNRLNGISPALHDDVACERLVSASRRAAAQGACLYLEPLSGDKPYPLRTPTDALRVVDRVIEARGLDVDAAAPGVGWLCDLYHLAANGLSSHAIDADLRRHGHRTAHLQVADAPGRGTPGTGTVPLKRHVDTLVRAGYTGALALEFIPAEGVSTREALASMTFAP